MRTLILTLICLSALFAHNEDYFESSFTNHTMELNGKRLNYTAMTGLCPILDGEEVATELFFIAYIKESREERPITFVFPGGPGGAGSIESILSFGPRRLLTPAEGRSIHPPYKLIDNQETILEYTDIVFVDPAGCGFSAINPDAESKYLFSVEGDVQTLGEFIHTFIDINHRWNSPVYLAGGSYGTLRCCGLAENLFQYGIAAKGIILDGCAFEFSTHVPQRDETLPDCLMIPTFAATAWYHKRLWPEKPLEEVVDIARKFAYGEFAPFMLQPSRFSHTEKAAFEEKLAQLIGLPTDTVKRYNCRINEDIYTTEFFGPERKVLGGLDTRYSGDIATINPKDSHDPSYLDTIGYAPAFNAYLYNELDTHFPFARYVTYSWEAILSWNFGTYDSYGLPSFLQRLRKTLLINPNMKVFVGSGYYDCRTPFAATEYCFEHLDLPQSYSKNIQFEYYQAGHGFIFDYDSLHKWKKDLTRFYTKD